MSLSTAQVTQLRTALFGDATGAALIAAGNANGLHEYLNQTSAFVAWRASVQTAEVGRAVNYEAVGAMTTANRDRIVTFYTLQPMEFVPAADVRAFWGNTFSGALAGQGAATREALEALWRRPLTHAERLLATGTGTTATPGTITWAGTVPQTQATAIVYRDDGTIWTP